MCGGGEQVKVAAITTAVYAHRAGALREERRKTALDLVASLEHEDLRRLAPRFYATLGEPARAREIEAALRTTTYRSPALDEAYSGWLRKIHNP